MKKLFLLFIVLFSFQTKAQNALHFDGNDDYVNLNSISTSMAGMTEFTVDFWLKFDIEDNQDYSVFFAVNTSTYGNVFGIRASNDNFDPVYDGAVVFIVDNGGQYMSGNTPIGDGVCHHIAFVYDDGLCKLYVDGNLQASANHTISLDASDVYSLGQEYDDGSSYGTSEHYDGLLSEFRIWNVAKTNSEILGLMDLTVDANTANLVTHFDFDEGNAGQNNTGLTSTANTISNGNGTLMNFSLNGTTSNYVALECGTTSLFYNHQTTIETCGNSYLWHGMTYTESGSYVDTVYSTTQDTIYHLNLTLLSEDINTDVIEINNGQLE
ncbi:MAG: LamG domain-containing protein, partial [Flavobacteriales bacterium]